MSSSVNPQEVEKFSRIADEWWDEAGKFKPLHQFNPIRVSFIRRKIIEHFKKIPKQVRNDDAGNCEVNIHPEPATSHPELVSGSFSDIKILDVGCGGGLIAEPFAKMGADVTAIDASEKNIEVAKIHAEKSGLKINYIATSAEEFLAIDPHLRPQFDVVFALEIIEHVADVESFVKSCAELTKANGLVFIATMNRNLKSFALAKIAAEYVLRWLPIGTHDWKKFLKPSEINFFANSASLDLQELRGFSYNILNGEWSEVEDLDVNYIAVFKKISHCHAEPVQA
jgi:2-polyprenyl-6-hydroxyphenyl methylase/3-demethylubiquinone-9 3-methyltransferase